VRRRTGAEDGDLLKRLSARRPKFWFQFSFQLLAEVLVIAAAVVVPT